MTLVKKLKKYIKKQLKQYRILYQKKFMAFSLGEFISALKALGLEAGDKVLVHSSYDKFTGFRGKPTNIIAGLQEVVGPEGVVLMPSMPFRDTAYNYVTTGKKFDVKRTPSAMGWITEIFRRGKNTIRSLHPTHPILACGPGAAELLADHMKSKSPCGAFSPFEKLYEAHGKILLLGTGINVLTYYHYLEEKYEQAFPQSPFTLENYCVDFTGYDGEPLTCNLRLFDPVLSKKLNLAALEKCLQEDGNFKSCKIGTVDIILLDCHEVTRTFERMIENKIYCYGSV